MNRKTIFLILCASLMLTLLAACSGDSKSTYSNNVAVADIGANFDEILSDGEDMAELSDTYIDGFMKLDISDYEEYCVKIATKGISINEYGIFKGSDADHTTTIEAAVKDYLQFRVDTWMSEYRPEEFPKLENAEIKVCGNYVMYAILSDEEKTAVFDAFENSLKAE